MAINHITIKIRLRNLSLALSLMLSAVSLYAQTYLPPPATLSAAPAAGSYYSNGSITLNPNFIFTAAAGSSLNLLIVNPDCVPLASVPSQSQNYIVTSVPRVGGILDASGLVNRTTCELMQTVQYFDGLGRPLQTVQVKGSTGLKDVVQPVAYDAFEREATKYLSYASPSSDGSYKPNAISAELGSFYGSGTSGGQQSNSIVVNPYPFSVTNFEPSPLNRVTEQGAPGTPWQPVAGNTTGHTIKLVYTTNNLNAFSGADTAVSMRVTLYNAAINSDQSHTLTIGNSAGNYYLAGQLYVTVSKDENWKSGRGGTIEEYKDKEGHVVLKRTFNYTAGVLQMLSTYYVYDDLGNLAFVLPPLSGADNGITTASNQPVIDNTCYQYRYDERNRLSRKRVPGKDWEYMVYNQLDQPVLSQDANQRTSNQWTVTKYDALGRVIMIGLWTDASALTQAALQTKIYAVTQPDVRNTADVTTGYTISSYPAISSYLSINYYDDYSFSNITGLPTAFNTAPPGASSQTRGLLTGSKINILGGSNMLWDVSYYDGLGRNMQTYKQHYLGGGTPNVNNYDVISNSYDFTNAVTATSRKHYNTTNTTAPVLTIANTYVYDHMGHKTQTFEQINGGTNVLLSQTDYNEIGQLKTKHLHSENNGGTYLQSVSYNYNERGWQQSSTTDGNLFNLSLYYNLPTDNTYAKFYNGNIAEMGYTKTGAAAVAFKYGYDQLNRLTNATTTGGSNLGEQVSYDLMGNITSLVRTGPNPASLGYSYYNNSSNRLQTVTNSGSAFRSYAYDPNGNATSDGGIKQIGYNLLNLPQTVTQNGTLLAGYTYDATGSKISNQGSDGYWNYINGIVYNGSTATNGVIKFIQTEEGRAIPNGSTWNYEYNLTDHLGNVRLSFDKNPSTGAARRIQEDEYYSFGLRSAGGYDLSNNNRYLYNGKEVQTDLTSQYDYGARFYDPVIGRWTTVDPHVENGQESTSPYGYVFDDPMKFTDPDGRAPDITIEGENNSSVTVKTNLINVKVSVSSLGIDFHGNHVIGGEQALQFGLDAVSIFDQSGISSTISAGISAKNGDLLGALLGVAGDIPILGEEAKIVKFEKDVNVIEKIAADGEKIVADGEKVAGNNLRNGHLAGGKHPETGVPFDSNGHPDFSEHLHKDGPNDVMIKPTGNRSKDFAAANKAAGYKKTPKGQTWHHHQQPGRMQLVDTKVHMSTGHTGGFSLW